MSEKRSGARAEERDEEESVSLVVTYGIGGHDDDKPDNNVVERKMVNDLTGETVTLVDPDLKPDHTLPGDLPHPDQGLPEEEAPHPEFHRKKREN